MQDDTLSVEVRLVCPTAHARLLGYVRSSQRIRPLRAEGRVVQQRSDRTSSRSMVRIEEDPSPEHICRAIVSS
jgi:hypothetical protein